MVGRWQVCSSGLCGSTDLHKPPHAPARSSTLSAGMGVRRVHVTLLKILSKGFSIFIESPVPRRRTPYPATRRRGSRTMCGRTGGPANVEPVDGRVRRRTPSTRVHQLPPFAPPGSRTPFGAVSGRGLGGRARKEHQSNVRYRHPPLSHRTSSRSVAVVDDRVGAHRRR